MDELTPNNTTNINIDPETLEIQAPDYTAEIVDILKQTISPKALRDKILAYHENDIAAAMALLNADERRKLYHVLDSRTLSDILEYTEDIALYFSELTIRKKVEVLSQLEADVAVSCLRQLEKKERSTLIDLMDDDAKREIALVSSFDEDEIGSRMSMNYIHVHTGLTVREAMKDLIDQAAENDNISTIYVVDENRTFYGAITLKDLIIARENTDLESIIVTSFPYFYAHEPIERSIEKMKDYSEDSIPVLDPNNKLLGVLRSQDMMEIVDDEMSEDYAKLAGLSAEEDLKEPVSKSMRKRLPWLLVLLGLGMLVSGVVGLFEQVVASLTLIVSFQSLVLGMAGNVGTQSLAVTIRVLMDENLSSKQKLSLVFKEARVGLCNGLILGIVSFVFIGFYLFLIKNEAPLLAFSVSFCTGIAMLAAMLLASISGTCIPVLFKKLKLDPAVASGPLITTVNDLVAIVTYYGLAWILLLNVLHL